MKKINRLVTTISALLLLSLSSSVVLAQIVLDDAAPLIGTWKLNSTSNKMDGKKRPSAQQWEFRKDGQLVSTAEDKRAKGTITVSVPYQIKDGKIVAERAGRPGKTVTYTLIKQEGSEMIIHGGADGYLFFKKQ